MKKITFLILVLLSGLTFSQEEGKVRVNLDLGYAIPSNGGTGASLYLEPMYNIKDNISAGIRIGTPILVKKLEFFDGETTNTIADANLNIIATLDYQFNESSLSFIPFIGAGIGYISTPNYGGERFSATGEETPYSGKANGMIRGGLEWKKIRLSIDYNLIPKSDLFDSNNEKKIGDSKNSYLAINLGFFVGGGKW